MKHLKKTLATSLVLVGTVLGTGLGASSASAIPVSFDVDFTSTRYQVRASDTFADLLAAHDAGRFLSSNTVEGLEGVSTPLYAGVRSDYSVKLTADLDLSTGGEYSFQIGADWGRGGGVALFETASNTILNEWVTNDDIWWAYRWNNPDVITSSYSLDAGHYKVVWLGFEGCCAGSSTVRYSYNGGSYQGLNNQSIDPFIVPTPAAAALLLPAFAAFAASRRRPV